MKSRKAWKELTANKGNPWKNTQRFAKTAAMLSIVTKASFFHGARMNALMKTVRKNAAGSRTNTRMTLAATFWPLTKFCSVTSV